MALVEDGFKYDSYHKFITSMGVIIVFTPFVVAAFMFAQMEAMAALAKEYAELTYPAKNLLELWMYLPISMSNHPIAYLLAFVVCEVAGVRVALFGLKDWKKVQRYQDTTDENDAELKALQIEEMRRNLKTSKATPDEVAVETTLEYGQIVGKTSEWQLSDSIKTSMEIEHRCINRLAYLLAEDYVVEGNVWIDDVATERPVYIDAIAWPRDSKPLAFAEVHYVWEGVSRSWAPELAAKISLCQDTLKSRVGGEVRTIVVIVLDDGVSPEEVLKSASFNFSVKYVSRSNIDIFELTD